jgi:hypothetical protein
LIRATIISTSGAKKQRADGGEAGTFSIVPGVTDEIANYDSDSQRSVPSTSELEGTGILDERDWI